MDRAGSQTRDSAYFFEPFLALFCFNPTLSGMKSKIGILGSGSVAKALGAGFLAEGHEVMIGSGNPQKLEVIKNSMAVKTGSFQEAAAFGKILVLAVKGTAAIKVFSNLENTAVDNKIIIDTTNPISESAAKNGALQYFTLQNDSLAAQLQKAHPRAHIVKAFNSVGSAIMYKPVFEGGKPTMFICGDHPESKKIVTQILDNFGWETADLGTLDTAGSIESLCVLWCARGFKDNQWNHAFKLLK